MEITALEAGRTDVGIVKRSSCRVGIERLSQRQYRGRIKPIIAIGIPKHQPAGR